MLPLKFNPLPGSCALDTLGKRTLLPCLLACPVSVVMRYYDPLNWFDSGVVTVLCSLHGSYICVCGGSIAVPYRFHDGCVVVMYGSVLAALVFRSGLVVAWWAIPCWLHGGFVFFWHYFHNAPHPYALSVPVSGAGTKYSHNSLVHPVELVSRVA